MGRHQLSETAGAAASAMMPLVGRSYQVMWLIVRTAYGIRTENAEYTAMAKKVECETADGNPAATHINVGTDQRNRYIKSGEVNLTLLIERKCQKVSWNVIGNDRNLASTYQQVIENMRYIQDEILPKIDILNDTVFDPDGPNGGGSTSDVIIDPDEILRVVGVSIIITDRDKDTLPGEYLRNVTYELKKTSVVNLTGKDGITLDHVLIKTIRMAADAEGIEYPTWQAAYGDISMTTYFRKAVSDTEWGDWVKVIDIQELLERNEEILQQLTHRQFIQSDNQPADDVQVAGDYWLQPLLPDVLTDEYFLQSVTDSSVITVINDETVQTFQFESLDDPSSVTPSPGIDGFELEDSASPYPTDVAAASVNN